MSEQARVRECVRTRLRQWSYSMVAVFSVLGVAGLLTWWPAYRESQHRMRLEAQYEPICLMKAENESLKKKIQQLHQDEKFILELSDKFPTLTMLGCVSRSVGNTGGQVFVEELAFEMQRRQANSQDSLATLTLEGLGVDRDAILQLTDLLQEAVPFASVQLEGASATEVNKHPMHTFTIECSF
ncbi:MAG: hypothetical protein MK171_03775 [Pirellulales bacterium]|nr:hypothetical protein [Pirellulales bacterium]